jgi:N-acetylmuramoyl-L-alanine amidase
LAVQDVQRRLRAAGFPVDRSELGSFGAFTSAAIEAFQEHRGLIVTGVCDSATWSALVEAGYRLGDRLLYLRGPMLRGDDVHALQLGLGALGFDAGRVDGIFGPHTEAALHQFQRNTGLTTDGVCGPEVCAALARLGRRTASDGVAGVRERERLRSAPHRLEGRRIVVGQPGGLDGLATTIERLLQEEGATVGVLHHPEASAQARDANAFDAELYIGLQLRAEPTCRAAFYATEGFRSVGGATLADLVARHLSPMAGFPSGEAVGLRLPILRETRMPAVVCFLGPAPLVVERTPGLATLVVEAVRSWVSAPIEG